MKRTVLVVLTLLTFIISQGQENKPGYQFTVVKENPITSIKNQGNSGTCWSFSGVGFLESELIRKGKGTYDLSEMYIVRRNYSDKGSKYIRVEGKLNFSQGGSFADVVETLDEYGVLPDQVYPGLSYGESLHKHGEIEAGLHGYVVGINENKNKRLSTAWLKGFNGILDAYFDPVPADFTYQNKNYTPQGFANELGLKSSDYVSLTSFTHHPFYTSFAIEIPDNWRWALSYNLPMDELMSVIDNAIESGFTVAWASDVSEVGFTRTGIAVIPDEESPENLGSDQAHWLGLSQNERNLKMRKRIEEGPVKEKSITQEMRQASFDNRETTDDHGMQIYGIAKDQDGTKYYMVKNSWGETGAYKGIWYASESFVKYKTTSIVIHKDALSKVMKKKLGF